MKRILCTLWAFIAIFASSGCDNLGSCNLACQNIALRDALGPEVYSVTEKFVMGSPIIIADLGTITTIVTKPGTSVKFSIWMDYSAKLTLKVLGPHSDGELELVLAGNNYKEAEVYQASWIYRKKKVPLDYAGNLDKIAVIVRQGKVLKDRFEKVKDSRDCNLLMKIFAEDKAKNLNALSHLVVTPIEADCLEQQGARSEAAEKYLTAAFFYSPYPFKETESDREKLRQAKEYLDKAAALASDPSRRHRVVLHQEQLRIQEERINGSQDPGLHLQLCEILAQRKVFYTTECPHLKVPPCNRARLF